MTTSSATADPNPARTLLRVAALDQWSAAAVVLAARVVAEAWRDLGEAARLFFRIAQAGRLAIVLAMRLSHPDNPAFQPVPVKPRGPRAAASEARVQETDAPERRRRARLGAREVSDVAILRRPLRAIVALICANLGVVPDWSLWSDEAETPAGVEATPPRARPRPKPIAQPRLPQGLLLKRSPGQRLIWTSPSERSPAAPRLRAPLRSSASPLALDPIAPRRAATPAWPLVAAAPLRSAGVAPSQA